MTATDRLLTRFLAVWGDPPSRDPKLYMGEIQRTMKFYPDDVISKSADIAIDTRVAWPRPAELRAIALRAAVLLDRRVPEMAPVKTRTPDEIARANEIMSEFRRNMKEPTCADPSPSLVRAVTTPTKSSANGSNVVRLTKLF